MGSKKKSYELVTGLDENDIDSSDSDSEEACGVYHRRKSTVNAVSSWVRHDPVYSFRLDYQPARLS